MFISRSTIADLAARATRPTAALLLSLWLAACGGGGGAAAPDEPGAGQPPVQVTDYQPLRTGDRWVYALSNGSRERHEVVSASTEDGQTTARVRETGLEFGETLEVSYRKTSASIIELADPADLLSEALGPIERLRLPPQPGTTFVQIDKVIDGIVDFDDDGRPDRLQLRSEVTTVGIEAVSVPAGSFPASLHVRTDITQTGSGSGDGQSYNEQVVVDEWLVAGIGVVRMQVRTTRADGTVMTSGAELEAYQVGGVQSDTRGPQVVARSPAAGAVTGLSPVLRLEFDEWIDATAVSEIPLTLVDATGKAVANPLTYVSGRMVTAYLPDTPAGTYTVRSDGSLRDALGNAAALGDWQITLDGTEPVVMRSTPSAGAVDVPLMPTFRITFSEPISPSSARQFTRLYPAAQPLDRLPVDVTVEDGHTLVVRTLEPLAPRTAHVLALDAGIGDLAGNPTRSPTTVPFQTGAGPFAMPFRLDPSVYGAQALAVGDVNGDGRDDLLTLPPGNEVVLVHLQQADGSLAQAVELRLVESAGRQIDTLEVVDLNGDGRLDVMAIARGAGIEIFHQSAQGELGRGQFLSSSQTLIARAADLNGDGRLDLVSAAYDGPHISLWLQGTDGLMGAEQRLPWPHDGVVDIAVADVDGNGLGDILLAASGQGAGYGLLIARQQTGGQFIIADPLAVDPIWGASTVAAADLNGDGRSEVVVASSSGTSVMVLRHAVDGTLSSERLEGYGNASRLVLRDLDADGRIDLAVAAQSRVPLTVALQTATGSFVKVQQLDYRVWTGGSIYGLTTGDLNGDGRLDLIWGGTWVMWGEGPGPGALSKPMRQAMGRARLSRIIGAP